ncbi:MAG: lysophospholipid acyltransferase family protein [Anaerolineae bacterium]
MRREEWPYYGWRAFHWLANQLPPWLGEPLLHWLGGVIFPFSGATHRNATENMRHVLGPRASDAEVEVAARAAFQSSLLNYYRFFRPLSDDATWARIVSSEGQEHFDEALARGRGVIIISVHLGGGEILAQFGRRNLGITFKVPGEPIQPESLYQWISAQRARHGGQVIPADKGAMELVRVLRKGGIIGVMADLDTTHAGLKTQLFDAPARLPQGPARLAMISRAPLVPFWITRRPDGGYHVTIEPPLRYTPTGDKEADAAQLTRVLAERVEVWVGRYPEQWMQFNPVWSWAAESPGET